MAPAENQIHFVLLDTPGREQEPQYLVPEQPRRGVGIDVRNRNRLSKVQKSTERVRIERAA